MLSYSPEIDNRNTTIVKVVTSAWSNVDGIHFKKSILFLRRRCTGYNILEEDASMVDPLDIVNNIVNFNEVKDGVYKVIIHEPYYDSESGELEDYNYKLIKVEE